MPRALPAPNTPVSVYLDGRWLSGAVLEASVTSGMTSTRAASPGSCPRLHSKHPRAPPTTRAQVSSSSTLTTRMRALRGLARASRGGRSVKRSRTQNRRPSASPRCRSPHPGPLLARAVRPVLHPRPLPRPIAPLRCAPRRHGRRAPRTPMRMGTRHPPRRPTRAGLRRHSSLNSYSCTLPRSSPMASETSRTS